MVPSMDITDLNPYTSMLSQCITVYKNPCMYKPDLPDMQQFDSCGVSSQEITIHGPEGCVLKS